MSKGMSGEARPRVGAQYWVRRALVLGTAIGLGLALQHVLATHLDSIQKRAEHDVVAERLLHCTAR